MIESSHLEVKATLRGLMSRPKLLMLDEMSLGLMPVLVEKMMETIAEINHAGVTVLLVEQMVREALEIADRGSCASKRQDSSIRKFSRVAGFG